MQRGRSIKCDKQNEPERFAAEPFRANSAAKPVPLCLLAPGVISERSIPGSDREFEFTCPPSSLPPSSRSLPRRIGHVLFFSLSLKLCLELKFSPCNLFRANIFC